MALIYDEVGNLFTKRRQQGIDKEAAELGNGQEVASATDVG